MGRINAYSERTSPQSTDLFYLESTAPQSYRVTYENLVPAMSNSIDTTPGKLMKVGAFGLGSDRPEVITGSINDQMDNKGCKFFNWTTGVDDTPFDYGVALQIQAFDTTGNQLVFRRGSAPGMAFRASLNANLEFTDWMEIYHTANVLGTVGQVGGVPTGAMIERGSNANGEYVRFADGTQICTHTLSISEIITANGTLYTSAGLTWVFPATFNGSGLPHVSGACLDSSTIWAGTFCNSSSAAYILMHRAISESVARDVSVMAVGKWF